MNLSKPEPKIKRISPVSKARAIQLKEYARLKKDWWKLSRNHYCRVIMCMEKATELHHSRGRIHGLLNKTEYWIPLCATHHRRVHNEPIWAIYHGLICLKGQWNSIPK